MIENTGSINRAATIVLILACLFIAAPLVVTLITATQDFPTFLRKGFTVAPGSHLFDNMHQVWTRTNLPRQIFNSFVTASGIAFGKVFLAFVTGFALVFFRSRYTFLIYAAVLATIMLPLELMIITMYRVTANVALPLEWLANAGGAWAALFGAPLHLEVNLLDTYAGIILPHIATGAAILIMVQFMRTLPRDLVRAATMDGASPLRFMWDVVLPLSKGPLIALTLFFFIDGWGKFMWPLIAASSFDMLTGVVGLTRLDIGSGEDAIPNFPLKMAGAIMVSVVPVILIAVFQRRIVRGLNYSDR
ncbi:MULTISPECIES: ABC transporter permease subunit [unclassified Mesorhizobium]|uniref:carbohydrate ABC transporter permease n=1 Tax=unclassified Mesorhizobium TaxID=325217 RepID=UPI000FD3612D|nr:MULTISPECIES: ABC transporter permease subunit [unclassified Mesorhizobium]RUV25083.1 ABC transporter permease subunit [Mesorhizobium sp. M5C.F.Ca.IN.020.32.2.1]RWG50734.1 MAG: ABC transporter permease subunit [Mesorhizobium sp.]RWH55705.1 MAG: ABC transporter permease subunit [Mesorhizobium sp.]RWI70705.1 MAG: ABC transporter permease subunit [Mesorhizobium sp.]RWI77697.1 MAG: ABC transporter permease subunit [Mesorhizobium sp.]